MLLDPHKYQRDAIKFILTQNKCLLFLDMGMGKTIITLTAISYLIRKNFVKQVLIIAPKAVAQNVWHSEGAKWNHTKHLTFDICVGSDWSNANSSTADIVVINKENACKINHRKYQMLVIDEVTCIKDPSTKLFKHIKKYNFDFFIGLTGTPLAAGLKHIWGMMFPVDGGKRLGKTAYTFESKYFYPLNRYILIPKDNAMVDITSAIKDKVLTLKSEDHLPINTVTYITHEVPFESHAKKEHDEIISKLILFDANREPVKLIPTAAVALNTALQICNGCVYTKNSKSIGKGSFNLSYEMKHHLKYDALLEVLETCEDNVLIAYQFNFDKEHLKDILTGEYNVRLLSKPEDIDDWNARKIKIGIAHPKSLGKGVNLQYGGSIIIWFGLTWSLEDYDQFNARLARQGQIKPVRVINLIMKNSVERQVLARLNHNRGTQSQFRFLLE